MGAWLTSSPLWTIAPFALLAVALGWVGARGLRR
jgi:hypothetical protein